MEQVTVVMSKEDLNAFAAVAQHKFVVIPTNATQPQVFKSTLPERIRQRILNFIEANPGATTNEIRQAVPGNPSSLLQELKVMRADGTLRVIQTSEHGVTIRHYPADLI